MRVKEGVLWSGERCPKGVQRPILRAMELIDPIMEASGQYTVTSLVDGAHGPNSLHYVGIAMDLRTRHMKNADEVSAVARRLQEELGRMYQVIVEKDHIHIEMSPLWLTANGDPRKAV